MKRVFTFLTILCNPGILIFVAGLQINSYAALGDSYAAGDGAGSSRLLPISDVTCGRFSGAYAVQVAEYLNLRHRWFSFHNVACGGATTKTVIWDQFRSIWYSDLITIQVGGNEVDFFPVLNNCIAQWHPISSCDRELNRAREIIQSTWFVQDFDHMVKLAMHYKRRTAHLMVLGYARFFNAETEQCNNATFSFTNPANVLSNELRQTLNDLVSLLNEIIKASAEAHGATYVNIDEVFTGHRFCEEGVIEPMPDWEGTWFFRETPKRRNRHAKMAYNEEQPMLPEVTFSNPLRKFADLTRTFHPTVQGHKAIAEKIMNTTAQLHWC